MVHPTATNVPEEDITSSSALDSQTHHTSPEAAAWTPSTRPQCSEEGGSAPQPPELPHLPALASRHVPTTTPQSRCPDRKCRAGAARCFRAVRGDLPPLATSPAEGLRCVPASASPPAHPSSGTRPPRSAGLSVSPCIWEVLLLEVDFLTLMWLHDPLAGVCQSPHPSLGLRSSCPQNPPEPWRVS